MATTGEGNSYEQGGGAGGKVRRRPVRRTQTTPYERPPTALRSHRNGWLSKLVDPASKLISASAHLFFSSVFRKRLLPPPPQPSPGANQESRDTLEVRETIVPNNPPGTQEPTVDDSGNQSNSYNSSGISALEQMLKQKTFTRSEIDRLTELLRSRSADLPVGDENKMTEANIPKPVSASVRQGEFSSSLRRENGIESHGLHGVISTPVVSSRVLEEDVATPAELAKAYMGSKPSKVLPLMSVLHGQVPREDATLPNNVPFTPKSPIMSLAPKYAAHVAVPENGFITPRSRGRSAIYCMARTPYPRAHSKDQKGAGSTSNGYGGSSSSFQNAWEKDGHFGSKQVALKRRSSVLEDDIRSVGPIRRIRQKPNLLSPKNLSLPVSGSPLSSHTMDPTTSSTQKLHLLDEHKHKVSKLLEENEDNSVRRTSFTLVPSKSTEMATKIFQHLDNITSTEKSSHSKLVAARDKLPTRLTPSMLSGMALKSLEDVDSSKYLQKFQNSHNLEDTRNTSLLDARDSISQKQDKVEEDVPKALVVPCDSSAPAVIRSDATVPVKNSVPSFKSADSASANSFAQPPQKQRAFRMSAHEDSLELDDDDVSTPLAEEREKLETPVVENKGIASEAAAVDRNPTLSEFKPPVGSELNRGTDLGNNDKNLVGVKSTSFTLPTAPSPSMALEPPVLAPQPTSAFGKPVPPKEPNVPPHFSFGNKNVDKSFVLPSSSSVGESSGLKSSVLSAPKPESLFSFGNVSSGATDGLENAKSDKGDNKNTHHMGNIMEKSGTVFSSALSTSTPTSSIFSFGGPASNSSLNNGPPASSPTTYSSSTSDLPSSNLANQNFTNSSMHVVTSSATMTSISTTTPTTASSSSLTTPATTPLFSSEPMLRFGSTVSPSTSVSAESTSGVQDTNSKVITDKNTTFGNLISSPFGGTSFAMAGTGTSIFGVSAPATSSTANSQSQGSLLGRDSGNMVGDQASAGTSATVTQTVPVQFGSSASSPVFGSTGTTFPSSNSLFSSSTLTSAGLSSAASSSETNSISSSGGASSLFGSTSWQPSKSPIFGASSSASLFNSPSSSTGFSFGSSSASVAATGNAPSMVFGSSTGASSGSIFSFTKAAANHSSLTPFSQTQPVFGNNPTSGFTAASGNGDQMNMEDSMAEDPAQACTPALPVFGQPSISTSPGFMFGSSAPSATLPFQFGGQQNQATQNASPFQASAGSLDLSAGGSSFSLGTGGGDKSRRIVRASRTKHRRK